jgi:hypothetical protein
VTSYFDNLRSEVSMLAKLADEDFIRELAELETKVAGVVSLCVGDREFPDDLREKAMGILAVKTVAQHFPHVPPVAQVREEAIMFRESRMVENLHSFFHEVARRRINTRFGYLSDSPEGNVKRRDSYDSGEG